SGSSSPSSASGSPSCQATAKAATISAASSALGGKRGWPASTWAQARPGRWRAVAGQPPPAAAALSRGRATQAGGSNAAHRGGGGGASGHAGEGGGAGLVEGGFVALLLDHGLRQPFADVALAAGAGAAERVEGEPADHGGEPGAQVVDRGAVGAAEPQPGLLD